MIWHLNFRQGKFIAPTVIIGLAFFLSSIIFAFAQPASHANISFPIAELGGCQSESECKAYCDNLENIRKCVDFAEKNGLMNAEEVRVARKFAQAGGRGPGDCRDHQSCNNYCENIENIEECLAFAERHGVLPATELNEAKKVAKALKEGAKLPGGCKNKSECQAYCEGGEHIEECLAFAEKAGFLPPEELKQARKFMELMQRGETPGGCRGERECRAYCDSENNHSECANFAVKAGLVSPEEAEIIRKTGGRGPGNCRSKDTCEAFCQDPKNSQACFEFAKKHGLIDNARLEEAEQGVRRLKEALDRAPESVLNCIDTKIGKERLRGILTGELVPSRDMAQVVEQCFRENFKPETRGGSRPGPNSTDSQNGPANNNDFGNFLGNASPEVLACFKSKVSSEDIQKAQRGERTTVDIGSIAHECFNKFAPAGNENPNTKDGQRVEPSSSEFHPKEQFRAEFDRQFEEEFKRQTEGFQDGENRVFDGANNVPPEFQLSEEEIRRKIEEETRRRIEEEERRRIEEQSRQEGAVILHRAFPLPSRFSPKNLNQKGASLLPFIINR